MSDQCTRDCQSCESVCDDREKPKHDFTVQLHPHSKVKKVIGVVSGKGGVGKSLVTSMLAVTMQRRGHQCAIIDADITGPSIPKAFGIKEKATGSPEGVHPIKTKTGIDIMSINLLLDHDEDPVVWRGPIIANTVKQFWSEVIWEDIDMMFIDMPPGTGDVPLTVFQSIQVDGIIMVTSPQALVGMIVEKAIKMATYMKILILGVVENMAYFQCDSCGKQHDIFGTSSLSTLSEKYALTILERLPVTSDLALASDKGLIELFKGNWFENTAKIIEVL